MPSRADRAARAEYQYDRWPTPPERRAGIYIFGFRQLRGSAQRQSRSRPSQVARDATKAAHDRLSPFSADIRRSQISSFRRGTWLARARCHWMLLILLSSKKPSESCHMSATSEALPSPPYQATDAIPRHFAVALAISGRHGRL